MYYWRGVLLPACSYNSDLCRLTLLATGNDCEMYVSGTPLVDHPDISWSAMWQHESKTCITESAANAAVSFYSIISSVHSCITDMEWTFSRVDEHISWWLVSKYVGLRVFDQRIKPSAIHFHLTDSLCLALICSNYLCSLKELEWLHMTMSHAVVA